MPEIVVAICSLIGTLIGSLAGIMTANKRIKEMQTNCNR